MVVSLSGKLTHLAHSLRHGSHSLRNAFPSTANPGFDFTSNVFGTVSNAAANSGGAGAASAIAAGALGAGAGAAASAGSSGGATGGSGGASSKAGSWGANWGFQVRPPSLRTSGERQISGTRKRDRQWLTRTNVPDPSTHSDRKVCDSGAGCPNRLAVAG